jgi:L-amino acid N-acyltransferase YncA
MKFEQHFEPVSKDNPAFGQIALIPWDIETFGFAVADYKFDFSQNLLSKSALIAEKIQLWAKNNNIELVGTTADAADYSKISFIQSLGFRYIDTTISLRYKNVQKLEFPLSDFEVLPADKAALEGVVEICSSSFSSGRYYADPRFPKHLADKRYQDWVTRAFSQESTQELFVTKVNDEVCGFMVLEARGTEGWLHLAAVLPKWQGKHIGLAVYAASMIYLQKKGVDLVHAKVSASNAPVFNLHTRLGARVYNSEILFHWHALWAEHLIKINSK